MGKKARRKWQGDTGERGGEAKRGRGRFYIYIFFFFVVREIYVYIYCKLLYFITQFYISFHR